jgi:hypothetical protein
MFADRDNLLSGDTIIYSFSADLSIKNCVNI